MHTHSCQPARQPPLGWRLKGLTVNHYACWHQQSRAQLRVCSFRGASDWHRQRRALRTSKEEQGGEVPEGGERYIRQTGNPLTGLAECKPPSLFPPPLLEEREREDPFSGAQIANGAEIRCLREAQVQPSVSAGPADGLFINFSTLHNVLNYKGYKKGMTQIYPDLLHTNYSFKGHSLQNMLMLSKFKLLHSISECLLAKL